MGSPGLLRRERAAGARIQQGKTTGAAAGTLISSKGPHLARKPEEPVPPSEVTGSMAPLRRTD